MTPTDVPKVKLSPIGSRVKSVAVIASEENVAFVHPSKSLRSQDTIRP